MLLPEGSATYSAKKPYSAAFRLLQTGSKLLPEGSATYSAKSPILPPSDYSSIYFGGNIYCMFLRF